MLGRVDRRSRPILAGDDLNTSNDDATGWYGDPQADHGDYSRDAYDYGDPTWYETSELELAARRSGGPATDHDGSYHTGVAPDERYWLDGIDDEIRLTGRDWIEGLRPTQPTSIGARLARLGSMLGIVALVGLGVVLLSVTQAGRAFEIASTPASDDDDSLDIDAGSQTETGSWFDEIPLLNRMRGASISSAADTDEVAETTTTTAWVEPAIAPASEWVDAGHGVAVPDLLLRIRFCESTNNYVASHVVSSARGAYQFLAGSWDWYGHAARYGVPSADQATPAQQDEAAVITMEKSGARPWAASRACWDSPDIDSRYATAKPPASATTTTATTTSSTTPESTTTTSGGSESTAAPETTATSESTTSTTAPSTTSSSTEASTTEQTSESQPDEATSTSTDTTVADGG